MTTPLSRDIGDQLGRIGRHWGWLLFFGILMVAAGVAAVAWPGPTVVVLAILFASRSSCPASSRSSTRSPPTSPAGCGRGM
jgi:hypothetical protein